MLGCDEFCAYYDWTFEYLRKLGGEEAVADYWLEAISKDSQTHAYELIKAGGFDGMDEYWGHTLEDEEAGYTITRAADCWRTDMHACPSLGLLLQRGVQRYHDYCDHCMGWIGPLLAECGFEIDHEHNHHGQCYWEMKKTGQGGTPSPPGQMSGDKDVRLCYNWDTGRMDVFRKSRETKPK